MSGSSKNQTVTNTTEIPAFLQPYLANQAGVGNQALTGLQTALQNGMPVTGFTPAQQTAQNMVVQGVTDPNGLMNRTLGGLEGIREGGQRFIDGNMGLYQRGIQNAIEGEFIPAATTNALTGIANNGFQLDPTARDALQQSASGSNLFGGAAFNEAVQASIRQARPSILSGFAGGGSGAVRGGLAQTAMQQAASDAFARLYGDERNRQLSAASQLGNFGLAGQGNQISAAGTLGNLNLGQQGLRNQALGTLQSAMNAERDRQVQTLMAQPGIGLMGVNALNQVGAQQQAQAQQEAMSGINGNLALLQAIDGAPFASTFGQTQNQPNTRNLGVGALGGALTGAQLGSYFGPLGTGIGAIGGGLLGVL